LEKKNLGSENELEKLKRINGKAELKLLGLVELSERGSDS
jgi:hypothetical protein